MELKFKVMIHVTRPVGDVFEAVADPKQLSSYFTTGGASGRLEAGTKVTWDFHDFPGAFPVEVDEVVPDERIVLRWEAGDGAPDMEAHEFPGAGYQTTVTMNFKPTDDGRTLVEIEEKGWRETEAGLQASYGNCMGWSQMLAALKMWVEHRINLREGAYK
ncbi:MAG: SRPBCC domain-containing protein [Sphingomicrobium sp.]